MKELTPNRRKACEACSSAKVRCDPQEDGKCKRCEMRRTRCTFPSPSAKASSAHSHAPSNMNTQGMLHSSTPRMTPSDSTRPIALTPQSEDHPVQTPMTNRHIPPAQPATYGAELICSIDASAIEPRWLKPFIATTSDEQPKILPAHTLTFLRRVLKSYTTTFIHSDNLPPFIHPRNSLGSGLPTSPGALSHIRALLRAFCNAPNQTFSTPATLLERELSRLNFSPEHQMPSSRALLSLFQAHVLSTLALHFHLHASKDVLQSALVTLQGIAVRCVHEGVLTAAEAASSSSPPPIGHSGISGISAAAPATPDWQSWITVEEKRRTLLVLHLFDTLLCAEEGLPVARPRALGGLRASSAKALWEAKDGGEWMGEWALHSASWGGGGGGLRIEELWGEEIVDEGKRRERERRVERWVGEGDGFGLMVLAVVGAME